MPDKHPNLGLNCGVICDWDVPYQYALGTTNAMHNKKNQSLYCTVIGFLFGQYIFKNFGIHCHLLDCSTPWG